MQFTRRNVWELGGDWADPVLWYARGVAAMKTRQLAEPTSWRFYAAIHGINQRIWKQQGYLSASDTLPGSPAILRFWDQCQHGSWYFQPWHRGYLIAFEANIRDAVVKLGGPADWALPYWNYFKPNEYKLPPSFASVDWPDGKGNNPLFVEQRYGPVSDGRVYVPVDKINLDSMDDPDFIGPGRGASQGFGGVDTGFEHSGGTHGGIETQPHDAVHGLVGGSAPTSPFHDGLMANPDTAGLDPIFWLHHANIDRLWEVWRQNPPSHVNPPDPNWIKGPANIGERIFSMPMPDGSAWDYIPGDMVDLTILHYQYDDLSPATPGAVLGRRLQRLGATDAAKAAITGGAAVPSGRNVELVGANQGQLRIVGTETSTKVQLDTGVRSKVSKSLAEPGLNAEPDRVFLDLENVRGLRDSTVLQAYIDLPDGANPADYPDRLAGSVALFGVSKASLRDDEHAGEGLTFVLEITKIIDALHLTSSLDVNALNVRIVPVREVREDAQISIGRVSIYRQGS